MKCELCGKEFKFIGNHIKRTHKIEPQIYYDTYLKTDPQEGKCLTCGNPTEFFCLSMGYRDFCCVSCSRSNERTQKKYEETNLIRYGVKNAGSFGEKSYKTAIKAKYGVDNISQIQAVKDKKEQTFLDHFGTTNNFGRAEVLEKAITNSLTYDSNSKKQQSMRKNGNHSRFEDMFEQILIKLNIEYKKDYNLDDRYPYKCDFYLPKTDTFIEINAHWTHNTHFYDKTNIQDKKQLKQWKEKAKTSNFYKSAIKTWTIKDIEKRDTAIKNQLNYIVLWNKTDIKNYIQTL